jgi:TPR repeat protein
MASDDEQIKNDILLATSMLLLLAVAIVFHVIQSIEIALKWLLSTAKNGNAKAQVLVGNLYSGAIGVKQAE